MKHAPADCSMFRICSKTNCTPQQVYDRAWLEEERKNKKAQGVDNEENLEVGLRTCRATNAGVAVSL
eukprot:6210340-Pleurochrysis_carterae.AAC.6